ncbi:unnamed protein product [Bursaphelenchus xylophilus]|nr:unnamed protein product [Bursaphelenchus xylophilus]CAG9111993.1 unnamed protein product [Bursaphelenchus xylophilus]
MKRIAVAIAFFGVLASASPYGQQGGYGGYPQQGGYPPYGGYHHHHHHGHYPREQYQYPENNGVPVYPKSEPGYPGQGYPGQPGQGYQPGPYDNQPSPQPGPYDPYPTKKACPSTEPTSEPSADPSESTVTSSDASESTSATTDVSGSSDSGDVTGVSSVSTSSPNPESSSQTSESSSSTSESPSSTSESSSSTSDSSSPSTGVSGASDSSPVDATSSTTSPEHSSTTEAASESTESSVSPSTPSGATDNGAATATVSTSGSTSHHGEHTGSTHDHSGHTGHHSHSTHAPGHFSTHHPHTFKPFSNDPIELQSQLIAHADSYPFKREITPVGVGNGTAADWKAPAGPLAGLNLSSSDPVSPVWGSPSLPGLDLKALPADTPKCVPDAGEVALTIFNSFGHILPKAPTGRCACPTGKAEVIITKGDVNAHPATYTPDVFSLSAVVAAGRGCPTIEEFEVCLVDGSCCKVETNGFTGFSIYPHCDGTSCKNRLVFQHVNDKIRCDNGKVYSIDQQKADGIYKPLDASYPEVASLSCGKTPKPFSCVDEPKLPAAQICPLPKENNALLLTDIVLGPVGVATGYCLCPETHAFTFAAAQDENWAKHEKPTFIKANAGLSCLGQAPLCACNSVTQQCWQVSNPQPEDIAFVPFCSDSGCWYNFVLNNCGLLAPGCTIIDRKNDKSITKEQFDQVKAQKGALNSAYPLVNTVSCGCDRALKLAQGSCSKTLLAV